MLHPGKIGAWYSAFRRGFLVRFYEFCKNIAVFCKSDRNCEDIGIPIPKRAFGKLYMR
jgi:hypothetical protein